jgi:hypothetical protein
MAIRINGISVVDDNRSVINVASITLPSGNATFQPITAVNGMIRFNVDLNAVEFHNGGIWYSTGNAITPRTYFLSQS